jgi:hypothetical protein
MTCWRHVRGFLEGTLYRMFVLKLKSALIKDYI